VTRVADVDPTILAGGLVLEYRRKIAAVASVAGVDPTIPAGVLVRSRLSLILAAIEETRSPYPMTMTMIMMVMKKKKGKDDGAENGEEVGNEDEAEAGA
jgi:hypothetical protein